MGKSVKAFAAIPSGFELLLHGGNGLRPPVNYGEPKILSIFCTRNQLLQSRMEKARGKRMTDICLSGGAERLWFDLISSSMTVEREAEALASLWICWAHQTAVGVLPLGRKTQRYVRVLVRKKAMRNRRLVTHTCQYRPSLNSGVQSNVPCESATTVESELQRASVSADWTVAPGTRVNSDFPRLRLKAHSMCRSLL